MVRTRLAVALFAAAAFAAPAQARSADDGLRFSRLEFAMPTDPLLSSSDPGWQAHATPAPWLADATGRIRAAVPAGMSADAAAAVLRRAGARCGAPAGAEMTCRYRDVETPSGRDKTDWDAVTWTVNLALADGKVGDVSVSRDWTRQ